MYWPQKYYPRFSNNNRILGFIVKFFECSPKIRYTQGKNDTVVNKLSQLPNNGNEKTTHESNYIT